jgi:hypothetical protein
LVLGVLGRRHVQHSFVGEVMRDEELLELLKKFDLYVQQGQAKVAELQDELKKLKERK